MIYVKHLVKAKQILVIMIMYLRHSLDPRLQILGARKIRVQAQSPF